MSKSYNIDLTKYGKNDFSNNNVTQDINYQGSKDNQ